MAALSLQTALFGAGVPSQGKLMVSGPRVKGMDGPREVAFSLRSAMDGLVPAADFLYGDGSLTRTEITWFHRAMQNQGGVLFEDPSTTSKWVALQQDGPKQLRYSVIQDTNFMLADGACFTQLGQARITSSVDINVVKKNLGQRAASQLFSVGELVGKNKSVSHSHILLPLVGATELIVGEWKGTPITDLLHQGIAVALHLAHGLAHNGLLWSKDSKLESLGVEIINDAGGEQRRLQRPRDLQKLSVGAWGIESSTNDSAVNIVDKNSLPSSCFSISPGESFRGLCVRGMTKEKWDGSPAVAFVVSLIAPGMGAQEARNLAQQNQLVPFDEDLPFAFKAGGYLSIQLSSPLDDAREHVVRGSSSRGSVSAFSVPQPVVRIYDTVRASMSDETPLSAPKSGGIGK